METFSWNMQLRQPVNFHWKWYGHRPCVANKTRGKARFVGPFNFAKGGMLFASASLVAQLVAAAVCVCVSVSLCVWLLVHVQHVISCKCPRCGQTALDGAV